MNKPAILRKRARNKGFSLVELIVVLAIMAVLIAIIAPRLIQYIERSRAAADEQAAGEFARAVQIAMAEESVYDLLQKTLTTTSYSMKLTLKDNALAVPQGEGGATGTPAVWAEMRKFVARIVDDPIDFKSRTHAVDEFIIRITATATGYQVSVSSINTTTGAWNGDTNMKVIG